MNKNQEQLVKYLSAAIRGNKINTEFNKHVEWKKLVEEAEAHDVKALLYYSLYNSEHIDNIDNNVLNMLKKTTMITAIHQIQHIEQIKRVLMEFNSNKIPVIVLKGLVIRELYPKPELRTMSDSDILIYREDIDKVKNLLLQLGYSEAETTPAHIRFDHKKHLPIEVHWTLADERYIGDMSDFENEVWQNAIEFKVGEVSVLSLSMEDLLFHLCLHMAVHTVSSGFGLRQICDLVLLVEKKGKIIDWDYFYEKLKKNGLYKFTTIMFIVCNELFEMNIPQKLSIHNTAQANIKFLIEDIFSGGVFGKRNLARMYGNELVKMTEHNSEDYYKHLNSFMDILFPSVNNLPPKYSYAQKHKILLPIAWLHHFIAGVFNGHYSLFDKIRFFLFSINISQKRSKLIKWLEL